MDGNAVGWFEIYVQDMERARKFYEAVFSVELEKLDSGDLDMWAFPMLNDKPGAPGALVKMEGVPSGGNSIMIYFSCENCANEETLAAANGGRVVREKISIGDYGYISLVTDTEGNMIGLHSMQ